MRGVTVKSSNKFANMSYELFKLFCFLIYWKWLEQFYMYAFYCLFFKSQATAFKGHPAKHETNNICIINFSWETLLIDADSLVKDSFSDEKHLM